MLLNDVLVKLSNKQKGTFVTITWKGDIENANAHKKGVSVTKLTTATVRWGVNYSKLAKVIAKEKERTEPKREVAIWYRHKEGAPFVIESLKDNSKTYLQIFPIQRKGYIKTKYFINGSEVSKKQVQESGYVNDSKFKTSDEEVLIMTVATDNIVSIGGNK